MWLLEILNSLEKKRALLTKIKDETLPERILSRYISTKISIENVLKNKTKNLLQINTLRHTMQ